MINMDVLCIGTAVLDVMALGMPEQSMWKEKQRIERIAFLVGGDAANQSIHLADAGVCTYLCACIGNDANGDMLEGLLKKRGVHTDFISRTTELSTGTALALVDQTGERHTFSVRGAHSILAKKGVPELTSLGENMPRAISVASLFSIPEFEKDGLLEYIMEANCRGSYVFADLGADKMRQGLDGIKRFLPYITYFLPSIYDALEMTGTDTAEKAAKIYRKYGCKNIIIKCGEKGCYYMNDQECGWVPAVQVEPVDTTGAGDCMVALFMERILAGEAVKKACEYACAGASASTLYAGASVQNLEKVKETWWC